MMNLKKKKSRNVIFVDEKEALKDTLMIGNRTVQTGQAGKFKPVLVRLKKKVSSPKSTAIYA